MCNDKTRGSGKRAKKKNNNNSNNKRERKILGEGNQPLVTIRVTSPKLSVSVRYKLREMEEASDI